MYAVERGTLTCTVSTGGLSFLDYVFAPTDSTTIFPKAAQYSCNKNSTPISIALGPSTGTNSYAPRLLLQFGADPLLYYVSLGGFTTACGGGSGTIWGDSRLNNDTISFAAVTGRRDVASSVMAFGCMPHGQNVAGGLHTDSVQMLVTF